MRYTVTAALPYANGPLHIGHLAGAFLPADIYARYRRLNGDDVLFVCGSDEHGVAVAIQARKEGVSPRQLVDRYHPLFERLFRDFDLSTDIYFRTSDPLHHQTAQEFFLRFYSSGQLVEQTTEQFYDPEAQMFLADRYVVGTCPRCGNDRAYGDQCERCGSALSPQELIAPRSALTGKTPELRPTTHFFFPLDRWQARLERYVLEEHADWKPNVLGQCRSWLQQGLAPRAITRDMDWGVPVPLESARGKVLYVWFDAPIGYISASRAWALERARTLPDASPDDWKPYWTDSTIVHFIGKDNIVFHCVVFPAMLMGHGEFRPPDHVPANEFLNLEGEKISTSRNHAVWLHEYLEDFPGKTDVLRYVLTSIMPETKDSDFSWKDFQERNNNELVAIVGNFVHRVLTLIQKYFGGVVPAPGTMQADDERMTAATGEAAAATAAALEKFRFKDALTAAVRLARDGNKYLTENEPWHTIKTRPERTATTLFCALQAAAGLGLVLAPFMPRAAAQIRRMTSAGEPSWADAQRTTLVAPGTVLPPPTMLFEKIEDAAVEAQIAKLPSRAAIAKPVVAEPKAEVGFETFSRNDLRVGRIVRAERIAGSDKLLRLEVDFGFETRTVVSGVARHHDPAELEGKNAAFVVNLPPRTLRGVESRAMLLTAERPDGALRALFVADDVPAGSRIG
ncbi:MAG: methionine--tRNA ligase [Bacteroidia bacterium]|nr:methionine--tRNA ligase [Bacteroidia bacterium]